MQPDSSPEPYETQPVPVQPAPEPTFTPPPVPPPFVPGYASAVEERPRKRAVWQNVAKASWVCTVVAFLLGCLTQQQWKEAAPAFSTRMIVSGCVVGLIITGAVLGAVALFAIRRVGSEGILAPALIGLILNGILIATNTVAGIRGFERGKAQRVAAMAASAQRAQQTEIASLTDYPGWVGAGTATGGGEVIAVEAAADAEHWQDFHNQFNSDFALVTLAVNNKKGTADLNLDPQSLTLHYRDGHTVAALPRKQIFGTAREKPSEWIRRFDVPLLVSAGSSSPDALTFFPAGTTFQDVQRMTVTVNGTNVVLNGRYYTAEQRAKLFGNLKSTQPDGNSPTN